MLAPAVRTPRSPIPFAAIAALTCGAIAFIIAAIAQDSVFDRVDVRFAIPAMALTVAASIGSLVRRERAAAFWAAGIGLALASLVLGWVLVIGILIAVTCGVIAILHALM